MKKIIVHSPSQLRFLDQESIAYCKSDDCYTIFHVGKDEQHVICKSLTKVFKELDPELFIKVSQSYVINKHFIKLIDKRKKIIELVGNQMIPYTVTLSNLIHLIEKEAI